MSSRKMILALVGLLVVSFGVSFGLTLFRGGPDEAAAAQSEDPVIQRSPLSDLERLTMSEHQVNDLAARLRERMRELDGRERRLALTSEQVEMAQKDLELQARRLEDLRLSLAGPLKELREARLALEQTRVRIGVQERARLQEMARVFERMDAMSSAQTIERMMATGQQAEAARILFFMEDRPAARVFSEMTDRDLAARLVEQIRHISEDS